MNTPRMKESQKDKLLAVLESAGVPIRKIYDGEDETMVLIPSYPNDPKNDNGIMLSFDTTDKLTMIETEVESDCGDRDTIETVIFSTSCPRVFKGEVIMENDLRHFIAHDEPCTNCSFLENHGHCPY